MPQLLLGPMLRYVDGTRATVWVETDTACEVTVLGHAERTFQVAGHHYGLLVVEGLATGATIPYEVALDGETVWPGDGPPSVIRTPEPGRKVQLAFGSCRVTAPLDDAHAGVDALHALATRMQGQPPGQWPDLLLLVGDQVYADDNISPRTAAFIETRRDPADENGPGTEVADFEEYAHLYQEAWSVPSIRWLFSTLPTAAIFDDHDVRDDWNTSGSWRADMKKLPWWPEKITSALMTYWLYQHLGNLDPDEIAQLGLLAEVRAAADGEQLLRAFATAADAEADGRKGARWSYRRDLGGSRLIVLDSRCGRVLDGTARRMLDEDEWTWFDAQASGGVDHLLIATSMPVLLPAGIHYLEAWNEAVCAGAWGARAARVGEKIRRAADLEHWAAFGRSFQRMVDLVAAVGSGERGPAPASITFLSGDVHFAYVATARQRDRPDVTSRISQAVCSPLRNPLPLRVRQVDHLAENRVGKAIGRALARTAGVRRPRLDWAITSGPSFDNQVAIVDIDGRAASLSLWGASAPAELERVFVAGLS